MATDYAGTGMTAIAGPDTVVLLAMEPVADFVNELWALIGAGASWDDVIGVLLRGSIVALPAMGLVHREEDATTVLLRGAMTATVHTGTGSPEVMSGARVTTWTERPFEGVTSVEFSGGVVADSEVRLPLAAGVVRAGSIRRSWVDVPEPRDAGAAEPSGVAAGAAEPSGTPAQLGDHDHRTRPSERPRTPRPPLNPVADGGPDGGAGAGVRPAERAAARASAVRCPNGHLNPPIAERCRVCDQVVADDQVPIEVGQPPVGRLRQVATGSTIALHGRVLVGREPRWEGRDTSLGEGANLADVSFFPVESPGRTVSRTHIEVRVTGWTVEVVDVSSSYTEVTNPGAAPLRLRRGSPAVVLPGAVLVLADDVTLRYEVEE